ncbi:nucleoside deaminase [Palleronia sp. LCG004]|uniref:nucleoside deaminase n=1 Tax=Palleronia sp. LCG004 TaxID=3079304 RepID=UPI002942AB12|nr:nucleoside deaminase [Palleronia sp. LCG004]WOI55802.1 nucleoside deaminase [Palleronia sp. LCG004]
MNDTASDRDLALLRRTYALASEVAASGNHPFAAILAGPDGEVMMEQGNAFMPDHDMTGHAERVLMTRASTTYGAEVLAGCTMFTSAEPCAMCTGAAYWAGIGRIVYGLGETRLKAMTGNHPENPTLDLPCRTVIAAGQREIDVVGPLLEEEGAELHRAFWSREA